MQDPLEKLEKMYMDEFLHNRGYTWESVNALPEDARKKLMTEASTYVSVRLAEVEGKAHLAEELHGTHKSS
jgi:hypothetical protein